MSQAQVLCEKMVISAWVLEFAWVVGADFACQMKISCHINRDLFVTSFFGVENCSPANVVVALVDFTQGVSFTLKHLRWFLKQNVWFPHLDMFSNMQAMCGTRTHSCMDESLWATHSIGENWWHVFAPVVKELLFCCRKLFLLVFGCSSFIHSAFVKFEELVTAGQSLLRISIAFWRGLRAWWLRKSEDFFNFFQKAKLLEVIEPFSALCWCADLFDEKKILVILSQYHNCREWKL